METDIAAFDAMRFVMYALYIIAGIFVYLCFQCLFLAIAYLRANVPPGDADYAKGMAIGIFALIMVLVGVFIYTVESVLPWLFLAT